MPEPTTTVSTVVSREGPRRRGDFGSHPDRARLFAAHIHRAILQSPERSAHSDSSWFGRGRPRRVSEAKVRVLIVGASGLIGSAAAARLTAEGHHVVAVGRRPTGVGLGDITHIRVDLARTTDSGEWTKHLSAVDAVLNCAGVLQDSAGDSTAGVHIRGASALFQACEDAGVRRVVHLSAVGVERETPTAFSQTKLAGDQALMARDLDWIILRPSVVVGRAAYGGSALIRGLAALPILPVMPSTAPLQIVHLDDLVEAIVFFLQPDAPSQYVVEVVGPKRYSFDEAVGLFRRWMRWPRAREIPVPGWLAGSIYRLGDAVAFLGWRPPVRSTTEREMRRGAVGEPAQLKNLTGISPRALEDALAREPASVQERWFARLYLLKPVVFGMFALFWITTGLVSLGPGWQRGVELVMEGGASEALAKLAVLFGGLADVIIGLAIAFRRTARAGLYAAFLISIAYAVIGTILVPWMWLDPLGPMLKIGPIMVFNLVALAILEDR
jgi:uncharacterized protein YbjT (DUF2867 family)